MPSAHFESGQVIFNEGDKSHDAYYLVQGFVEISVKSVNGKQVLAKLGPGEVFGEMGMIMDRPRSATAMALETSLVEVISEPEFEAYFLQNPERLHTYLATLFERIRKTDLMLQASVKPTAPPAPVAPQGEREPTFRLRLRSCYDKTGLDQQAINVTITKLPFRIGRAYFDTAVASLARNDLSIDDHTPYQVSRNHCEIAYEHGHFVLRDRGSKLGTYVNGEHISVDSGRISIDLKPGLNEVSFGTIGSLQLFELEIEQIG